MSTVSFREETIEREWFVVDLEGQTLGRAASRIAGVLRGKHKPTYTPNADCGDFVIVINADKVKLTSNKLEKKVYNWHTGYLGGIKSITAAELEALAAAQACNTWPCCSAVSAWKSAPALSWISCCSSDASAVSRACRSCS